MKKPIVKKTAPNDTGDTWKLYPVASNYNIVRLPIFDDRFCESITFDKTKSVFSITELKTTGLISDTTLLNLDGYHAYTINMTYPNLCKILFSNHLR
ncbi:MAG: hypothetical protein J6Q22_11145 [Prevotella sp.]|nr:hypothetical protein [Prevotella sp.]